MKQSIILIAAHDFSVAYHTINEAAGVGFHYISCGEEGRGRHLARIPVVGFPDGIKVGQLVELYYKDNDQTKPRLKPATVTESTHFLYHACHGIGFRGGNSYAFSDGIETIAEGTIAQGTAGAMGSGSEYILACPLSSRIKVHKSGRLYGEPASRTVIFPNTFTPSVIIDAPDEELDNL